MKVESSTRSPQSHNSLVRMLRYFAVSVVRSMTDLNFYIDVLYTRFRYSLRVLLFYYVIIGTVLTALFTFRTLPEWQRLSTTTIQELAQSFPDDAVLTWDGSVLSSNRSSSTHLPLPPVLADQGSPLQDAVVIDTSTSDLPENVSSIVFINAQHVYVNSLNGRWTDQSIHQILGDDPYIINKGYIMDSLPGFVQMTQETLAFAPFFAFFFFSFMLFIGRCIVLLFDTIIIQFVIQLMGKPLKYVEVYKMNLHLLIPVELINQISLLLYPDLDLPMFTISFWILASILLWHLRNLHVVSIEVQKEK